MEREWKTAKQQCSLAPPLLFRSMVPLLLWHSSGPEIFCIQCACPRRSLQRQLAAWQIAMERIKLTICVLHSQNWWRSRFSQQRSCQCWSSGLWHHAHLVGYHPGDTASIFKAVASVPTYKCTWCSNPEDQHGQLKLSDKKLGMHFNFHVILLWFMSWVAQSV
jgi:hypothetical protein